MEAIKKILPHLRQSLLPTLARWLRQTATLLNLGFVAKP